MGEFSEIVAVAVWLGMLVVNGLIAEEKGRSVAAAVLLSLPVAPLVYLYLLAVPIKARRLRADNVDPGGDSFDARRDGPTAMR